MSRRASGRVQRSSSLLLPLSSHARGAAATLRFQGNPSTQCGIDHRNIFRSDIELDRYSRAQTMKVVDSSVFRFVNGDTCVVMLLEHMLVPVVSVT
ncbi:hypothetical protein V6N12_025137 [Hibiscus sabdariffa]|uniref:Uncharacterized protein n=1 Tax=Hibiscus sabdariffa TaxID=183260 RepID=A0ABR2BM96_9ROSI